MSSAQGKEILIIKIDVAKGVQGEIRVHELDEPEDLSRRFCRHFRLDQRTYEALVALIDNNIGQLIEEQGLAAEHRNGFDTLKPRGGTQTASRPVQLLSAAQGYNPPSDQQYRRLFKLLNPVNGLISHSTLNSAIPQKTLRVLSPFIEELSDSQDQLDFTEFRKALNVLLTSLTESQKNIIFQKHSRSGSLPRRSQPRVPTYERLLFEQAKKKEKLNEQRQVMLARELKECTFQPNLRRNRA